MEKWVKNKDNIFYHLNRVKGIKSEELYPLCGVERYMREKCFCYLSFILFWYNGDVDRCIN